jgi:hypothetical protein
MIFAILRLLSFQLTSLGGRVITELRLCRLPLTAARVFAMAAPALNASVPAVNEQLGFLVLADFAGVGDGFILVLEMPDGSLAATLLGIPSPFGIRHDMVTLCFGPLTTSFPERNLNL